MPQEIKCNRRHPGIITLIIALMACACSNEVDLNADGMDLPVVYCLLDMNSADQFIRLSKTYSGSRDYQGQIPPADSLILPGERSIYLEEWQDGDLSEIFFFEPYQFAEKDSGLFPIEGFTVYHSSFRPKPLTKYVLYIYFPKADQVISGETTSLGPSTLIDPADLFVREINFTPTRGYTLRWITSASSGVYQPVIRINYSESTELEMQFKKLEMVLPLKYVTGPDLWITQDISPGRFFQAFVNQIEENPAVSRELISMDCDLYSSGEDLAFFVKAQMPTFWMNLAQYTNLDNGFGIFSSLDVSSVRNLQFSLLTKYHLATDSLTRQLNFINPYE